MPSTAIFCSNPATTEVKAAKGPNDKFVGDVFLSALHNDKANTIATVMFTPCARTNWHTHEGGQLIRVISGKFFPTSFEDDENYLESFVDHKVTDGHPSLEQVAVGSAIEVTNPND